MSVMEILRQFCEPRRVRDSLMRTPPDTAGFESSEILSSDASANRKMRAKWSSF